MSITETFIDGEKTEIPLITTEQIIESPYFWDGEFHSFEIVHTN